MYTLVRTTPRKQLLTRATPALLLSLVVAEAFYKFHSFVLECVAFLATWYAIELVADIVSRTCGTLLRNSRR